MTDRIEAPDGTLVRVLPPLLMALVLFLLLQTAIVVSGADPTVLRGELIGPDSYMRITRVERLVETGDWFENVHPRGNAPYGEPSLWTRPFDVFMLMIALPLRALTDFDTALYWAAVAIGPIIGVLALIALIWAGQPIASVASLSWLGFLFVVQVVPFGLFAAGRADHHSLIMLVFILSMGLNLRLLLRPFRLSTCWLAGLIGAFSLWLTAESMIALIAHTAALVLFWLFWRPDFIDRIVHYSLALFVGLTVALVSAHPPAEWWLVEYDRISILHWSVAGLNAGAWSVLAAVADRASSLRRFWPRVVVLCGLAFGIGGFVFLAYPDFLRNPLTGVDPRLTRIWLADNTELQPLLAMTRFDIGPALIYLGIGLLAIPSLAVRLARSRGGSQSVGWWYIGLLLVVFVPLALFYMVRWVPYAAVSLLIPYANLIARIAGWLGNRLGGLRLALLRPLVVVAFALGFPGLGVLVDSWPTQEGLIDALHKIDKCRISDIARHLNQTPGLGDRQHTVLAFPDFGPELIYRTDHNIIGAPNLRSSDSILDTHTIFSAVDDRIAHALVQTRRIDLVLLCPMSGEGNMFQPETGETGLYQDLVAGGGPNWLRAIPLPTHLAESFMMFEVIR